MEDLVPPGAVPISRIERHWTADEQGMPLFNKLGLLEQAKAAACIPMYQSAPDPSEEE